MPSRSPFASHPVVITGVLRTTMSAVLFTSAVAVELLGLIATPYGGLIIYIFIPAVFVLGLLLIPFGNRLDARHRRRDPDFVRDWPVFDLQSPGLVGGADDPRTHGCQPRDRVAGGVRRHARDRVTDVLRPDVWQIAQVSAPAYPGGNGAGG